MPKSRDVQAVLKERLRESALVLNAEFSHASPKDNVYRKDELLGSMFSIDDDDAEEERQAQEEYDRHKPGKGGGADLDLARAVKHRTKEGYIVVDVDAIDKQSSVRHSFLCAQVTEKGYMIPSHLVLTDKHVILLREQLGNPAEALVMWRREYAKLIKIAAKKKHPDLLSFYFECEADEAPTEPWPSKEAPSATPEGGDASAARHNDPSEPPSIMQRFQIPQHVEVKAAVRALMEPAPQ